MIKSERKGSLITIIFDHYTIEINECRGIESLSISDDRDKEEIDAQKMAVRDVMNGTRSVSSLDFSPISKFIVEAISKYNKQFVVCIKHKKHKERIFIDYENPNNCKFVELDNNGSLEFRSTSGLAFTTRYSEKKVEEDAPVPKEDKSFIKKEVFIIMNDRILMYHLPFHGKVTEYLLKSDAVSKQILVCCDYARIKGSIIERTFEGLSIDGKPLPVESGYECPVLGKLESPAWNTVQQVYIAGVDGKKFYIDTYSEDIGIGTEDGSGCRIKLKDPVTKEIKDFYVDYAFSVSGKRFIYQTAV